jgi:hypothetical protein
MKFRAIERLRSLLLAGGGIAPAEEVRAGIADAINLVQGAIYDARSVAAGVKPVAVLRVYDIAADADGTERRYDAHAIAASLELQPGNYELVLRTADGVKEGSDA